MNYELGWEIRIDLKSDMDEKTAGSWLDYMLDAIMKRDPNFSGNVHMEIVSITGITGYTSRPLTRPRQATAT